MVFQVYGSATPIYQNKVHKTSDLRPSGPVKAPQTKVPSGGKTENHAKPEAEEVSKAKSAGEPLKTSTPNLSAKRHNIRDSAPINQSNLSNIDKNSSQSSDNVSSPEGSQPTFVKPKSGKPEWMKRHEEIKARWEKLDEGANKFVEDMKTSSQTVDKTKSDVADDKVGMVHVEPLKSEPTRKGILKDAYKSVEAKYPKKKEEPSKKQPIKGILKKDTSRASVNQTAQKPSESMKEPVKRNYVIPKKSEEANGPVKRNYATPMQNSVKPKEQLVKRSHRVPADDDTEVVKRSKVNGARGENMRKSLPANFGSGEPDPWSERKVDAKYTPRRR